MSINLLKPDSESTVVKKNALVNASYRLTANEQRLILAVISQVDSMDTLTDQMVYTLHASELEKQLGSKYSKGQIYRVMKSSVNQLFERTVSVSKPICILKSGKPSKIKPGVKKFRWVQSVGYDEEQGQITLRFGKDIIPYLSEIQNNFTKYQLKNVTKFKSVYSVRFYEWFIQYLKIGHRTMSVAEIRYNLDLENLYPSMGDFKLRVLDIALKEIKDFSDIEVTYEQQKRGREITHFTFKITTQRKKISNPVTPYEQSKQPSGKIPTIGQIYANMNGSDSNARPGESSEEYARRLIKESRKK